jgi:predicted transcriptional regulator
MRKGRPRIYDGFLHVRLKSDDRLRLNQIAKRRDIPPGVIARRLILDYMAKEQVEMVA